MSEKPLVSILISSYNKGKYLEECLKSCISQSYKNCEIIFHLAAQPIVSISYEDPVETITSNTVGTMNVMEILRKVDWQCAAVLITSDKSYKNLEKQKTF